MHYSKEKPSCSTFRVITANFQMSEILGFLWYIYSNNFRCPNIYNFTEFSWASSWENVSSGVSDQVRLKLACSATEASIRLEILVTETRDITLSRQWTTKVLIRLRGCAGWSPPWLFAYDIRQVLSLPGSVFFFFFFFLFFLFHFMAICFQMKKKKNPDLLGTHKCFCNTYIV